MVFLGRTLLIACVGGVDVYKFRIEPTLVWSFAFMVWFRLWLFGPVAVNCLFLNCCVGIARFGV